MHGGFRHYLLLATYVTYTLVGPIHDLAHAVANDTDADCPRTAVTGASFWADCPGPCEDPSHHHHRGHDRHECVVCRFLRTAPAVVPSSFAVGDLTGPTLHTAESVDAPAAAVAIAANTIRGPPPPRTP